MRRISIVGTTGSGKSTLARQLAEKLGVSCVELDAINWQPNWTELSHGEMAERVQIAVAEEAWVIEGGYSRVRSMIWGRADTVIWLDYPFPIVFWRLLRRTILRSVRKELLWNGNRETIARTLCADSILIWLFRSYWRRKRQFTELLARDENQHLQVLHFQSPEETDRWLNNILRQV